MKLLKILILLLGIVIMVSAEASNSSISMEDTRKGDFSFHGGCLEYGKVYRCMLTCKKYGHEVYMLNQFCQCRCYVARSTTNMSNDITTKPVSRGNNTNLGT